MGHTIPTLLSLLAAVSAFSPTSHAPLPAVRGARPPAVHVEMRGWSDPFQTREVKTKLEVSKTSFDEQMAADQDAMAKPILYFSVATLVLIFGVLFLQLSQPYKM